MPAEDELDIRVPEDKITYPEYETYKNQQAENEVINPTEEEIEEIGTKYLVKSARIPKRIINE